MATKTTTPKIDFQPNWKKEEQCFEEEKVEVNFKKAAKRNSSPGEHDKSVAQLEYENWLEKVVNPRYE